MLVEVKTNNSRKECRHERMRNVSWQREDRM